MKWLWRILGTLVALLVALFGLQLVASESGEVVVVKSRDAGGEMQETRLWVVDHEGDAWLRSGAPQAGWFLRMQANPKIEVSRGDLAFTATAVPDVAQRDTINRLMREKYGWADQVIAAMFGREDATPIRLER